MLNTVLNTYLVDHYFEKVRKFNHEPNQFNFEEYTQQGLLDFKMQLDEVVKTKTAPIDIGKPADQRWRTDFEFIKKV